MCSHTVDLSRPLSLLAATVRLMIAGQPSLNSSNVFPFLSLSLSLSLSGLSVQGVGRREQIGKSAYFAHASFSFRDSRSPSSSSSCVLVMRRNFPVRGHTHITSTKVLFLLLPPLFITCRIHATSVVSSAFWGPPSSTHCGRHMCMLVNVTLQWASLVCSCYLLWAIISVFTSLVLASCCCCADPACWHYWLSEVMGSGKFAAIMFLVFVPRRRREILKIAPKPHALAICQPFYTAV